MVKDTFLRDKIRIKPAKNLFMLRKIKEKNVKFFILSLLCSKISMYDDGGKFQPKVLVARTYRTSLLTQTPILFYTLENFLAFTGNSSMSNNSKSETRKMILGSFLLLSLLSVSPAALTSGAITQNNSSTVAVNSNLEASPAGLIYSLVP